ncbi:MAG: hypothetical protein KKA73_30170 [Chloroflexi bacterium]|nr:hypothetical protein [Chloroflexota bacterium]MBU1751966.1 hypothetical protein [Chloroflexota bacterium]
MLSRLSRCKHVVTLILLAGAVLGVCAVTSCDGQTAPTQAPPTAKLQPTAVAPTTAPQSPTAPLPTQAPPTAAPQPTAATQPGLPLATFTSSHFSGSGNCATCHTRLADTAGNDVSIDTHWRSAMMANAARDPFWQATVASEVMRFPALRSVIEDTCANCHTPMARHQALADGTAVALLDSGFLNPDNPLSEAGSDGVSCTLCHQIQDKDLGQAESFSGKYFVDTSIKEPDRPSFGPFPDPPQDMMRASTGFTPLLGQQTTDPGLCATCHTLYTPYVDDGGNVQGTFPEQTPFLEWQHSAYAAEGQTCQGCHMPEPAGPVAISNIPRNLEARSPFAQHHFVGGNVFMLDVLKSHVEDLGLTASTDNLDATRTRTMNQFQNRTANLAIVESEVSGDTLTVALKVENKAGHKFPTGFPWRRAWLHVTVTDANGKVVFESGQPQADGSIAGCDTDQGNGYESHYDMITSPDQVQIYEAIMHGLDGQVTYTLLRGSGYIKDNRLLPRGFDKATADQDFSVYGSATLDRNFAGGEDWVTYQIDTQGAAGPFTVTAELLYQSISRGFMTDLRHDEDPLVDRFGRYYDEADKRPVVVASVQETVR